MMRLFFVFHALLSRECLPSVRFVIVQPYLVIRLRHVVLTTLTLTHCYSSRDSFVAFSAIYPNNKERVIGKEEVSLGLGLSRSLSMCVRICVSVRVCECTRI